MPETDDKTTMTITPTTAAPADDIARVAQSTAQMLPEELAASTGFLLTKASQRALEVVEAALSPLGIRTRHYGVLTVLTTDGPLPQGELGERLGIDRTTMVSLIDSLESLHMVERRVDPTDRRVYRVQLTEQGLEAASAGRLAIAAAEDALFGPLGGKEWRRFHSLLRRFCGLESEASSPDELPADDAPSRDGSQPESAPAAGKGEKQRGRKGKRNKH